MKNEIVIFKNQKVKLEVNMKQETVWLSVKQMALLFDREDSNIRRHIKNVFKENELTQNNNVQNLHVDGVKQLVPFYSLDVIISVGYRVKSQNGVIFRQWANNILKDYMIKGYAINKKRLEALEKMIELIDISSRNIDKRIGNESTEILKLLKEYSKAFKLLDDYDHKTLKKTKGNKDKLIIPYSDFIRIIKKQCHSYYKKSDIFGKEKETGNFQSIINNIYLSFDGKDLYPTIEEKATHLLYFISKDHVFLDGNKRIAATLFIYFLQRYNILYKNDKQIIDNNALTAITILIAESNPKEKDLMIDLVMNFLQEK